MAFTAADVKTLREMTGVGMMDCKKALTASDGDMDKAVEWLREKGMAASAKKAGRIAAEGMVYAVSFDNCAVVVEVNAETDFVAKNDKFVDFTKNLATVEPGAEALVNGGYGLYQTTIDNVKPTHMIIIAGGIGVVPMLSIVDANPDIDTTFFYNAHAQNNLLYPEKFARWEQRDNFTDYLQVGRFDDETILNTVPRDLSKLVVLIGGPAPMGRHWVKLFSQLGLNSGQIYYEEFSW